MRTKSLPLKIILRSSVLVAITLAILGCAVGPDYEKPETQLPDKWISGDGEATPENTIQQDWWQNFHDPVLTQLIAKASAGNFDLKIAEARIAEARASRSSAEATLLPSGDLKGSATREANQLAVPGVFPGINQPFNIFQVGFDASWELDLFGGHRREIESASAELEASEASRDDVRISLMAEVARTYVNIRQYQAQIKLAQDIIKSDTDTVRIVTQRANAGVIPRLDLTQAEAQLQLAEAQLPYYTNLLAQAEYSMDVLLGEQPGVTYAFVEQVKPIPVSGKKLVLTAPASVIANRPDIRMAERKLESATAQQGVAVAKFFPDISLSGFVGVLNTNSSNLLMAASKSWMTSGTVLWPILSYGSLSANLDAADAQQQEAMVSYRKSMIGALSDVEKSVTAYTEQEKYKQSLAQSVEKNRQADDIAQQRYKEGQTSFLEVLDADRTLYASENQLIEADAKTSENLVAVYKSLGGGWKIQ